MSVRSHSYVVILAGGEGNRFAPLSTPLRPKQFLNILDSGRTMIQQTFDRVRDLLPPDHVYVSTNERYLPLVAEQLPEVGPLQVVAEPVKKNTAPPIAVTTRIILERDPEGILLFLPADHFIARPDKARESYATALSAAATARVLVTFGIPPTFPSTQYGYIHRDGDSGDPVVAQKVLSFVEKPDEETAKGYLASGRYFWNSGQFAWRGRVFLENLEKAMPSLSSLLGGLVFERGKLEQGSLNRFFGEAESLSIDYGVMEKSDNVVVIPFDAGWSDVGTWEGLADLARRHHLNLPPEVRSILASR